MRTIEVSQGTELPQQVPVPLGFVELDEFSETYERVSAVEREGEAKIATLAAELDQARAADRDKLGDALIQGGATPKESSTVATLEGKIAAAQRDLEGAVQARRKVAAQIADLIAANSAEWVERHDEEIASELVSWALELALLEARAERIAGVWTRRHWAAAAGRGERRVKQGSLTVPGLLGANREELHVANVLRQLADVGKPRVHERPRPLDGLQAERMAAIRAQPGQQDAAA